MNNFAPMRNCHGDARYAKLDVGVIYIHVGYADCKQISYIFHVF